MVDLRTNYMGVPLNNPLVVGSCSLSKKIDVIKKIEQCGAGALVIKSLFEEQVQWERGQFERELEQYDTAFAEAVSMFPKIEHGGPKEHLYWVEETRKAVTMPLFASLNCIASDTWLEYAKRLEDTGVNGLELNFYSPPLDANVSSGEIEKYELEIFQRVRAAVKIPLAVKLHPYYTSLLNVVTNLDRAGADGIVLFNRLFQPDIDIDAMQKRAVPNLSEQRDGLVSLRWLVLCHSRVKADLVAGTGITSGRDAIKMILAGASAVQVVSALYKNQITHLTTMLEEMTNWMKEHHYENLAAFKGMMAKRKAEDSWSFERGQYIKTILGID